MVECVESPRVLLVDGRTSAGERLRRALVYAGYEALVAYDGRASVALTMDRAPDVAVIDLGATDYDGLAVCRRLRRYGDAPALIVGSQGTTAEAFAAFEAGADDYMAPPIALEELQMRVKALLRRARRRPSPSQFRYADLSVDTGTRIAMRAGRRMCLTATELDLLVLFLAHPDQVLTHQFLLDNAWHHPATASTSNLECYVHALRVKLEAGGEDRLIQTVRGVGYVLRRSTASRRPLAAADYSRAVPLSACG